MQFDPTVADTHIHDKVFDEPMAGCSEPADCIGLYDGRHWVFDSCIIDVSTCSGRIDEAIGVTCGSSAQFTNCVIRGADKLILCGSGDEEWEDVEQNKLVMFDHCILEDFGRRGPEVQSGMRVRLRHCLIRDWGRPGRFDTRSFAAWAHHGGKILAEGCVFSQRRLWNGWKHFFWDLGNHLGQAWQYNVLSVLDPRQWLPGPCRALYASHGGWVSSVDCHANRFGVRVAQRSTKNRMSGEAADSLYRELYAMQANLYTKLKI